MPQRADQFDAPSPPPNHRGVPLVRAPRRALTLCFVGTIALVITGMFSVLASWSQLTSTLSNKLHLLDSAARVRHLEEVLAMSVHMHAATGDPDWRARHDTHTQLLRHAQDQLRPLAPGHRPSPLFDQNAGDAPELRRLNQQAMRLVDEGQRASALELLESEHYRQIRRRHEGEVAMATEKLFDNALRDATRQRAAYSVSLIALIVIGSVIMLGWVVLLGALDRYHKALQESVDLELEAQHARLASEAKSEFLANMSHEIRTPMTAILGFADLLDTEQSVQEDPEQSRDAVRTIQVNARHLLRIIDDILDVSKIEAGRLELEKMETDPIAIVEEVASLMRPRAVDKGIELRIEYTSDLPEHINSDPTRVRQILLNLLGNSVKFTESGSVTIRAWFDALSADVQDVGMMYFQVRDTGIGMSPDQVDAISRFEAFRQADSTMARRFGGSGLGLRICNDLASMLGGHMEIESTLGEGSVFTVCVQTGDISGVEFISAEQASARELPLAQARQKVPAPVSLRGLRILLAEDGLDNQKLLRFYLERAGASVETAENGEIAYRRVRDMRERGEAFSLILMDMQMPELDGYGATRALRSIGVATPIIAITAHAMDGDAEKCRQAGCNAYLSKPVNKGRLIGLCAHWGRGGRDDLGETQAA